MNTSVQEMKDSTKTWFSVKELISSYKSSLKEDTSSYSNLSEPDTLTEHLKLIVRIANTYLCREGRQFEIDPFNYNVILFLMYYFNNNKLCESIFPEKSYKLHKPLFVVGQPGVGKTFLFYIFSIYLKMTNNSNYYENTSVSHLINYHKRFGHIDKFTYNEDSSVGFRPSPINLCLNDLGIDLHKHKSYGTNAESIIEEFIYSRYEIAKLWFKKAHITSNLTLEEISNMSNLRIMDRLKEYNIIELGGNSRRI